MSERKHERNSKPKDSGRDSARLLSAADIIGCPVSDISAWRELEDGSLIILDRAGRKYHLSAEDLQI